jgi:hypothetical protein
MHILKNIWHRSKQKSTETKEFMTEIYGFVMMVFSANGPFIAPKLSWFRLKTETKSSLRKVIFQIKYRMMDNAHNYDS